MATREARAWPRVGLLGNPSDLYEGRVVGFTFSDFAARARIGPSSRCELCGPDGTRVEVGDLARLDPGSLESGCDLLAAALRRLAEHAPAAVDLIRRPFRLEVESDIPRQVGLSGSSALAIAALRALAGWFEVPLDPFALSELALAAETRELGRVAGPQDRVLQAFEGLLAMDFREPRDARRYARLDPALLPPLFLAWDSAPGEDSSIVHKHVLERWRAGDPATLETVDAIARLADEGVAALRAGDASALADLVDRAFEQRATLFPISRTDRERVAIARAHDAGATLCGSGGAIVGVPRDPGALEALRGAYEDSGHGFLRPSVGAPGG